MATHEQQTNGSEPEQVPLSKAAEFLLEEARMVLPGMQALFGFQLIAVFSAGFADKLTPGDQRLHLLATGLVALAIALIMTPAAYHRQVGTRQVSSGFIELSSRLLLASLVPLGVGLCLEFFVIATLIVGAAPAAWLAAGLLLVFVALWVVLPRVVGGHRFVRDRSSGPREQRDRVQAPPRTASASADGATDERQRGSV